MRGLIMTAIYFGPFVVLGIATRRSTARRYRVLSKAPARGERYH